MAEGMTPRAAIDRLRGFVEDRERRGLTSLSLADVRGVIDHVAWPPEGLVITERDAGILLALIDGRPVLMDDLTALTGRLAVVHA